MPIVNSRWLLAPFYFGLVISLLVFLLKFLRILGASEADIILGVLSLINVALTANLVVIVVFSGYGNFVSRMTHPEIPIGLCG